MNKPITWSEDRKRAALHDLTIRQEKAKKEKRVDNASLYAGSPMYYYCGICGLLADTLPESHIGPPRRYCGDCQDMIDHGFSRESYKFV